MASKSQQNTRNAQAGEYCRSRNVDPGRRIVSCPIDWFLCTCWARVHISESTFRGQPPSYPGYPGTRGTGVPGYPGYTRVPQWIADAVLIAYVGSQDSKVLGCPPAGPQGNQIFINTQPRGTLDLMARCFFPLLRCFYKSRINKTSKASTVSSLKKQTGGTDRKLPVLKSVGLG
eukprot:3202041-Rhodomonas_salina.1